MDYKKETQGSVMQNNRRDPLWQDDLAEVIKSFLLVLRGMDWGGARNEVTHLLEGYCSSLNKRQ